MTVTPTPADQAAPAEVEGLVGELLTGLAKLISDAQQEQVADIEDAEHTGERPDLWDYHVLVDLPTAQAIHTALTALQADNERLREALTPFADVARYDIGGDEAWSDLFVPMGLGRNLAKRLTVGDFRRAAHAKLKGEL